MEKSNRVINTKLFPPKIGTGAIARPRLLRVFAETPNWRGAFITAPAGYGKTVLMIQTVKGKEQPLIWYQLDAYDNAPLTFLQYLTEGFKPYIPGLEAQMAALFKNPDADVWEKAAVFIKEVVQKPGNGFFLVLDDFHVITDPETLRLVLDLLDRLPNVRFLISGRTPLPPEFSGMLTNQEYLKFNVADLKFNSQEIALLMARSKVELSDTALADLEQETHGWAAAFRLLSITSNIDADLLANLNSEELYNYLSSEVFEQLPPEIRRFLTSTSVLEDFSSEFCDCLLNRNDSRKIIKQLLNAQLFLIPLEGPKKVYRYHQLFQQFLLERMKPDERLQLLKQAGDSAKQSGDPNRAIDYYLSAGYYEEAIRLIVEIGDQIFIEDYWQRAFRWLVMIPEERMTHPWLFLLKAVTYYNYGTQDEAEKWITRAIQQFKLEKNKKGLAVAESYKALILFSQGRYLESLKLTNSNIIKNSDSSQGDSFNIWPYAMLLLGRLDLALSSLLKKLKKAEQKGNKYAIYQLAQDLCTIYYAKGDYDQALEMNLRSFGYRMKLV